MNELNQHSEQYTLENVRLETGFLYREGKIVGTDTALFTVTIAGGKIKEIRPGQTTVGSGGFDAKENWHYPSLGICTSIWIKPFMVYLGRLYFLKIEP
ncbi:hypothetical protein KUH03_38390 [Sphingobacterium sp. E70]|uniref:hypothetical protein n=1 Tax=Sphingobacterium sp. E70 TaxID=2853439 RepID=UPI00211BC618|nr:hypothetical protein [Sphingobacterium sp. E70]ULT24722.1 hypothetical protein KUH03_38390 [Sphingobacterium sp. E70]